MVVKVTKPEINVREKLSELDKPSSIAGEAILRANNTQEQFNLIGAGRRNMLINGTFEVSQRGNYQTDASGSALAIASGTATYSVDRWYAYGSGTTCTSQTRFVTLPTGQKVRSLRTVATSASTNSFLHPAQQWEVEKHYEGQVLTSSAWVRTNRRGQYLRLCDTVLCYSGSDEIPADGEWHYMTQTWNPITNAFNYSSSGQWQPAFGAGPLAVGDYVEFALPQLELGNTATPFEFRHKAEELALCQRYFQIVACATGTPGFTGRNWQGLNVNQFTTTRMFTRLFFPTQMRTSPTVTVQNPNFAFAYNGLSRTLSTVPNNIYADMLGVGIDFHNQGTSFTPGQTGHVDLGGTCKIVASAEL